MLPAVLITLREGLEAALIIGIILAYLARIGRSDRFGSVFLGAAAAIGISVLAGVVVFLTVGELEGTTEEIFEGIAMLLAAVVLSWMVVWMRHQSINIRQNLHRQVAEALQGSALALPTLAFVVIVREGLETALFLFAAVEASGGLETLIGGVVGLAIAVTLGYWVYRGTRRLNLRLFFGVTGALLILFAVGLLTHGMHELEEAEILPSIVEHVWDTNAILPEQSAVGRFLTALFGYNGNPSLLEVFAYVSYLAMVAFYYFRPATSGRSSSAAAAS